MPKFAHCFYDNVSCKFGAIELDCEKSVTLITVEIVLLAKAISIKVLDQQDTSVLVFLAKNPEFNLKIASTEKRLNDKISLSKIWI